MAVAAVGGAVSSVLIFILIVCIVYWYKKTHKETSEGEKREPSEKFPLCNPNANGSAKVPRNLHIPPDHNNTSKAPSTTPTPYGDSEDAQLLPHHKNHAALHVSADSPCVLGAHNPGYGRLLSTTPTTPSDTPFLRQSSNAASAASPASPSITREVKEPGTGLGLTVSSGADSGASDLDVTTVDEDVARDDPEESKQHIYDEINKNGRLPVSLRPLPETPDSRQQKAPSPAAVTQSHDIVHTHSAAAAVSISTCAHCHNCNILLFDTRGQQGQYPTNPHPCTSCGRTQFQKVGVLYRSMVIVHTTDL